MVLLFDENVRVDILFLSDVIALAAVDPYWKCPDLVRFLARAFAGSRISVFGRPRTTQMGAGGEWGHEAWAEFCSGRSIRL